MIENLAASRAQLAVHRVEQDGIEEGADAGGNLIHAVVHRVKNHKGVRMGLKERKRALVHSAALAGRHLQEVEHAGLGDLEGTVEVLTRMDVGAALPLHLHQRADGKSIGLAKDGTGTQDVEELMIPAKLGEAVAQLGVDLIASSGKNLVHLGDAVGHVCQICVAFLLVEDLCRKGQGDAGGNLGLGNALAPRIDPARPLAVIDARAGVVGLGDNGGAGGLGDSARIDHLGRVAGMAASDNQGLLAQTLGTHDVELTSGICLAGEGGRLALQQLVGGQQVDEGAAAGNPEDAIELAFLGDGVGDEIVRIHCCASFLYGGRCRQRLLICRGVGHFR